MQISTILWTALNAVLPIILVILLGYILRQKGFLSESFLQVGNKLVFRLCLPAMLLRQMTAMRPDDLTDGGFLTFACIRP